MLDVVYYLNRSSLKKIVVSKKLIAYKGQITTVKDNQADISRVSSSSQKMKKNLGLKSSAS